MPRDPYEVLGVERDVAEKELKSAFRRMARELHPDVNSDDPEAEAKFKEAAEAYEVLSDPERRRTYDAYGHDGLRSGGWSPGSGGFGNVEDLLSSLFGQGSGLFGFGRQGPAQGGDIGVGVEITLGEVLTGAAREVSFESVATCERCRGNGAQPGTPIQTCETCGGAGAVQQVTRTPFGQMMRTGACPTCGGQGKIPETPCEECGGAGRLARERTYDVEIPAGIEHGQRVRIAGAGHAGEAGAPAGDLYVEVAVAEDPRFERRGQHLVSSIRVAATRAMLGGKVSVATLDGEREVKVPAGAQPGETVRLKGLGLPTLRGPRRGDQHVVIDVYTPTKLSREAKKLAERLDDAVGDGR